MRCNDQSVLLAMHIAMSNTCSNESLNVKRDRPRAEDPLHILKVAPPARMNRWVANQNEQHSSHGERRRSEPWFLHAAREFNSHKRRMGCPGKSLLGRPYYGILKTCVLKRAPLRSRKQSVLEHNVQRCVLFVLGCVPIATELSLVSSACTTNHLADCTNASAYKTKT